MRIRKLYLRAFGPFSNRVLDFGGTAQGLVLVHGPNEAGKSSTLRAISDLRFGIPMQSKDDFVHEPSDMRIGGEFVDRHGKDYALLRRKGRGVTLVFADLRGDGQTTEMPVPPEVEALLTCGLTKQAYESMFGLNHQRLREGGQALQKGEGDIGAALFEASAGVRSIPQVLERLEGSARKFFMPGARGKNARINEALAAYEDSHNAFKQAQVRPAQWADLFKKHQAAAEALASGEGKRVELSSKLLLIQELRAVAPLISTIDNSMRLLSDLASVTLLSESAPTERAAAESGLSDAQSNARAASADLALEQKHLDELTPDTPILEVGPAVKRLAASAESIGQHRKDLADALIEVELETGRVAFLATRIDASLGTVQVLGKAPTKAQKAQVDELLRGVELAQRALDQHMESERQGADPSAKAIDPLPSAESRAALRVAQEEVARSDQDLKRLVALPGDIKAAQRAAAAALDAVGLVDEAALRSIHPLLDAQIDSVIAEQSGNLSRRNGYESRIGAITKALEEDYAHRERLLEHGVVATRDDVSAARSHRELGWALVRGTYIDGTNPPSADYAGGGLLPDVYEKAVTHADQLVDALAKDTDRAAQLQGNKRRIDSLEADREKLHRDIEELDEAERTRQTAWNQMLSAANLPAQPPASLRDWQALLPVARAAVDAVQTKLDELERIRRIEDALATSLRAAIISTGLAAPTGSELLSTLSAMAADLDRTIKQREAAIHNAEGTEVERERQGQLRAAQMLTLTTALQTAKIALRPVLASLLLPEIASVSVARARIVEFDDLVDANARLTSAETKKRRAEQGLSVVAESARAIWESLGDKEPSDLRLYSEHLSARLAAAEAVRTERTLAEHAMARARISESDHEKTASRHSEAIVALCRAANVESASLLPEAEVQSRRKRQAQEDLDRSHRQLVSVSRHSIEALRALLVDQDTARMDADEAICQREQASIDKELPALRGREELARHQLEAIDGSDVASAAREAMERAAASVRSHMSPWIRSRIAHAVLAEALTRFRDRAQGPMLLAASGYFHRMTRGEFVRLLSDDSGAVPSLVAERSNGSRIRAEVMSDGTADQLHLALRLAAVDIRRSAGIDLPLVLDDVLMTSDEERTGATLEALADFARENQVIVFTHHRHIVDVAVEHVTGDTLTLVPL